MSHTLKTGPGTFPRGVHPPDRKEFSEGAAIEVLPTPKELKVPYSQHIGAPATARVKNRDAVAAGDLLATAEAFICAPVHSPIDGTVGMETAVTLPNGKRVSALTVKAADEQQLEGEALKEAMLGGDWPLASLEAYEPEQIVEAVKAAGIVGLGGAAFPTFVKLLKNDEKPIDTIVVNGCECEPYLTADYRLMLEAPEPVICGAMLTAKAAGAEQVIIAIEDNKPDAIEVMTKAAKDCPSVTIAGVHTKYPQGGEKQVVKATLDREIPGGGLPLDVGAVVINVGTASAIAGAVVRGRPLTHRVITITGEGIANPKNVLAPIGVSINELIDFCGGLTEGATKIISGGPMMGFAIGDLACPATKGTSGITVLAEAELESIPLTNCVRCGKCVDICPLRLVPTRIALACRAKDWELAKQWYLNSCCECGSCAYVCPAGLPLLQMIRMGKVQSRKASQ